MYTNEHMSMVVDKEWFVENDIHVLLIQALKHINTYIVRRLLD